MPGVWSWCVLPTSVLSHRPEPLAFMYAIEALRSVPPKLSGESDEAAREPRNARKHADDYPGAA
eukprot:7929469-Pyramimonas_sp.AAC.1